MVAPNLALLARSQAFKHFDISSYACLVTNPMLCKPYQSVSELQGRVLRDNNKLPIFDADVQPRAW